MELDTSQEGIEAYFDRFMAGELHGGEMIRVVTNPKVTINRSDSGD